MGCLVHYFVPKGFPGPKKRGFGFADEMITIVMLLRIPYFDKSASSIYEFFSHRVSWKK